MVVVTLLGVLVGAVIASVAAGALGSGERSSTPAARVVTPSTAASSSGTRREVASTALTPSQIYEHDAAGVVAIRARTAEGEDAGTGIVVNDEGLILTNDHVIAGASGIEVSADGRSQDAHAATLVGEEANSDLALIRVDPSGLDLKPLTLASSSAVQVGDSVYAIGNPYGLSETLTRGIVSALGREISAPDGARITGAIQTDAALNPGNSGGPLLDEQGRVIGVNSQIASDAASVGGSQPGSTGVGFAIASNTVAQAIKTIEAGKGISAAATSEADAAREGREGEAGAEGAEPAEGAGGGEGAVGGAPEGRVVVVP
jgi:putative serine protease PepD